MPVVGSLALGLTPGDGTESAGASGALLLWCAAVDSPRYVIGIVGGATAGAETAGLLAARGATVVVFEQNTRPYGKIEDGLPRWHVKLRQKEYETVNQRLDHPNVHFVPLTRIGRDIDFRALTQEWGFTAVILALGAWRDPIRARRAAPASDGSGVLGTYGLLGRYHAFSWPQCRRR